LSQQQAPGVVLTDPRDQPRLLAERSRPRTEVGGLSSAADGDAGRIVVVDLERALGRDRDVKHQVADRQHHQGRE
jgi:hypothetical protein